MTAENPPHILIALHGPPTSTALDQALRSAGFSVTVIDDGAEAIHQSQLTGAALIVVGEFLRDGLGIDLVGKLSQYSPSLPVIFFAEKDSLELLKHAVKRGAVGFLTPPFHSSEVLDAVRAALDLAKRRNDWLRFAARQRTSSIQHPHGRVLGVLGVVNRHNHRPLTRDHASLLNALSEYAVIALENARLYAGAIAESRKLEAILTGTQDGIMVVDQDQRVGLINKAARDAFGIDHDAILSGKLFQDVFPQQQMRALAGSSDIPLPSRIEVSADESRVFSIQVTPIAGVGRVFTMHDITYLKKLDSIKTDFVHTISHDLRSPLTTILGYVELIERAGPINDLQRDFIHRVQGSVRNITSLVDDLLNLGRIESGFDLRKENVHLEQVIRYSAYGMRKQMAEKNLHLQITFSQDFPVIFSNPVQMREMSNHLLDNAIKYSTAGSLIIVSAHVEQNQLILQFSNEGMGISAIDLPFIFDRFYRGANASAEVSGTGLGLAIVKSVVENHSGRVWVESSLGKGAIFTIVLPDQQGGIPAAETNTP